MSTSEILQPAPSLNTTPVGDTLLRNFRATLETSWAKFDNAVPTIWKAVSDDYTTVKQEYESSMQMLGWIKNDEALRADVPMRQKLDNTIRILRKHNADSDKEKRYNQALVEMEANLANLQKDVEKNNTTLPVTPILVATAWWAIVTEAISWLWDTLKGWIGELGKESEAIKKNPMKKMVGFLGFTDSSIVSDFKEALSEKKEWWFEWFIAEIKLWFYGLLAKIAWVDFAKHLTPEEMKLAGIKPKIEVKSENGDKQTGKERTKEVFDEATYKIVWTLLIKKAYYKPGASSFSTGLDVKKSQDEKAELARISAELSLPEIRKSSYTELSTGRTKTSKEIQSILSKNESMLESILHGSMPDWKEKPLTQIFQAASLYGGFLFAFDASLDTMKSDMANMDISKTIWNLNIFNKDSVLLKSSIEALQKKEKWGFTQRILEIGFGLSAKLWVGEFQTKNYPEFEKEFTNEEKLFMQKFFAFSTKILSTMYGILDTDSKTSIKSMWEDSSTTPQLAEIMSLYILTGGNADISSMNLSQKTAITLAPLKFATERNDAKVLANLIPYYSRIITDGESLIPADVREVLKMSFQEVQWSILEKIGALVGMSATATFEFAKNNPLSAAAIATAFLFGWWAVLIGFLRAKIFILWGTLVAALTAYIMPASASPKK